MANQMLRALMDEEKRGTLANPGIASPLGPTLSMKTGAFLHPLLQAAKDKFPKDNPRGRWLGEMLLGDSPQRTGRVAEGVPDQYFHYNRGSGSNVSPELVDLAAALPIGSAFKLAKLAAPLAAPVAMATSAAALNRLKAPGYAATSTDDIGAALLGRSLQTTGDLNKAMVGGDAGAAALARIGNTAPQQAMELAEQMESAGRSRDEIWAATADLGYPVFRGKDGRLRFEIDDSAVKFKEPPVGKSRSDLAGDYFESKGVPRTKRATGQYPELDREALAWADANRQSNPTVPVYESIIHPEMQQAYPGSGVRIGRVDPGTRDLSGYFDPATKEIRYGGGTILNTNKALARILGTDTSTALHELQHATQEAEGFARGGSPGGPYQSGELDQLIQRKYEQIKKLPGNAGETKAALYDHAKKLVNSDEGRREMYRALAGEAEARQVQARMDMSPAERAYKPFYADYDVPEADQIVRYGDGPSASSPKSPLFDTSRPLYRASNSKHDDFVTSIGHEHGVRGVSTTPDREYALTHGDVLEEVYGPKGEYIDAFELDDRYSHHLNEKYKLGLSAEDIDELSSSEIWIENVKGLKFAPSSEFNAASDQLDNDMADWAIDQGYVGSRFLDPQAGEDLRIFDPANIRRINATTPEPSVDEFIGGLLDDELPLDEASRMHEATFGEDLYHGTVADIDEFEVSDLGVHLGTQDAANVRLSDKEATRSGVSRYKTRNQDFGESANILPVRTSAQNPLRMDDAGEWRDPSSVITELRTSELMSKNPKLHERLLDMQDEADKLHESYAFGDLGSEGWYESPEAAEMLDEIRKMIEAEGYDSIKYTNFIESRGKNADSTIVLNPKNIRSKFAKFDPAKKDSAKLLAGAAGAGVLSGLYEPDALKDDEKMRRALLRN